MSMIESIVYYGAACHYSDETCFTFEIYLLVDHSKMLVFIKELQKVVFSVEQNTPVSVSTA